MAVELTKKNLNEFAKSNRDRFEKLLKEFVETPTVSAQSEHKADMQRGVDLAVRTIRDLGGDAKVLKTKGNPLVYGKLDSGRNAPVVTVYNHMDVQPASRDTEPWDTDPFVMTTKGDTYYGRGTTDDKGPALSALLGAVAAREAGVKANIRFLWEFEEEIGSPSFEDGIAAAMPGIRTDSMIVSDTIWVARNRPACPAGLRGLSGFLLSLETGTTDVHSGTTGGLARNPLGELMKVVSQMYDATTGKVKIPGFYDDVLPPTKEELRDFANSGFSVKGFKTANKLKSLRTDNALEAMKRLWAMPTMEIHGVVGGYTGEGVKTVIPPRAEVKVSTRLVANQDPHKIQKLVKAYVKKLNPDVKVTFEAAMYPYKAPTTGPLAEAVKNAMRFAFGHDPVFVREGGSIGAVASMEKVLNCPVMFLGLSLPEHGYHAPNENYDWAQARGGMIAFAKYFEEIANLAASR